MKILMVIPYFASVYGGPAKVVEALAQTLSTLSLEVDLITTNANGAEKLDVPVDRWAKKKGYRVRYFDCWHRNDFILSFTLLAWLVQHVRDYDLVHVNNIFAPLNLAVEWICQRHNVPYVITPHGMLEPWALSYKAGKKRFYYQFLEKPALRQAKAIHVLNPVEANHVRSLGFERTAIIPNGINEQEFVHQSAAERFYQAFPQTQGQTLILFLARIDPKKGLDLLAPAFSWVHQQFPNTHLIVAGPDNIGFQPIAENYFAQVGCLQAVTFTGMLMGELKQAALAAASLYVAPSYSEGFSMSVLEGMASGLPCVITTGCNFPEAADMAHIVNVDADEIATAMLQCLQFPDAAKRMGDRARDFVLHDYTWHRAAEKLADLYRQLISQEAFVPSSLEKVERS